MPTFPIGDLINNVDNGFSIEQAISNQANGISADDAMINAAKESWDIQRALDSEINPVQGSNSSFGSDAISRYSDMAAKDSAYMEPLLQLIAERENTLQAQKWYESLAGSQYSRAMEDIKKAGYNPYLVLQGISGAGSGSVSAAGTSSISGYQNKLTRQNNTNNLLKALASIAGVAFAIGVLA